MTPPRSVPAGQNRLWIWLLVGLASLAALGFGTAGLLKVLGKAPNADLAKVQGQGADGNLIKTEGATQSGLEKIQQTTPEKKVMPDDVRAWLEHLEETEKRLVRMTTGQISQAAVLAFQLQTLGGTAESLLQQMAEGVDESEVKSPAAPAEDKTGEIAAQWRDLRGFFESVPPPAECRPIYDDYARSLDDAQYYMETILQALTDMSTGAAKPEELIAKLQGIKNDNRNHLDAYRKKTDDGVGAICDKYDTQKWFSITPDVGGEGGMLKSLGGF